MRQCTIASYADFVVPDTKTEPDIDERNGIWLVCLTPRRKKVILFVHGLNGHPTKTWGNFAEMTAVDASEFDLAFYGYTTPMLSHLVPFVRKPSLVAYAQQLRRSIWESLIVGAGYDEIVLVCHSLGGILVKAAIQQIEDIDVNRDRFLSAVHSVFFFGTPHFGSDRVRGMAGRLSPVLSALRRNAKELERVRDFWRYRVAFDPADGRPRRILLHARAIYSDQDFWVDSEAAQGELEQAHTYPTRVSHSRLVNPAHAEEGHFSYFIQQLRQIEEARQQGHKFNP